MRHLHARSEGRADQMAKKGSSVEQIRDTLRARYENEE